MSQQNETIQKNNEQMNTQSNHLESLIGVIVITICILLTCYIEQF